LTAEMHGEQPSGFAILESATQEFSL